MMTAGKIAIALSFFMIPTSATAGLMLAFDPTGAAGDFSVDAGGTVDVPVYLIQTPPLVPGGDLTTDGLISMGVQLDYDTSPTSATVSATTQDSVFSVLQDSAILIGSGSAAMSGAISLLVLPVTGDSILLGTVTFDGNSAGDVTSVSVTLPSILATFPPYFVSGSVPFPTTLDGDISTTATTRITTVPEPGSFAVMFLGGGSVIAVCLLRRRRRRPATER